MKSETDNFLIYSSEDGHTKIDVMLEAESLWLSQKQFTELFGKAKGTSASTSNISLKAANWMKIQLFGFSEQLPLMANSTK